MSDGPMHEVWGCGRENHNDQGTGCLWCKIAALEAELARLRAAQKRCACGEPGVDEYKPGEWLCENHKRPIDQKPAPYGVMPKTGSGSYQGKLASGEPVKPRRMKGCGKTLKECAIADRCTHQTEHDECGFCDECPQDVCPVAPCQPLDAAPPVLCSSSMFGDMCQLLASHEGDHTGKRYIWPDGTSAWKGISVAEQKPPHTCASCGYEHERLDGDHCGQCDDNNDLWTEKPIEQKSPEPQRPTVVCLCGSTRFYDQFKKSNLSETLAGRIVLSIGCDFKSDDALGLTDEDKKRLDELHKRKIDLADEILVLNVRGYAGDSTKSEIQYAIDRGKRVRYLESEKQPEPQRPEPGEGWRLLEHGERIQYGDELMEAIGNGWILADYYVGTLLHQGTVVRRRVEPVAQDDEAYGDDLLEQAAMEAGVNFSMTDKMVAALGRIVRNRLALRSE